MNRDLESILSFLFTVEGSQRDPSAPSRELFTSPLTADTRVCTIETSPNHTAGFAISGMDPPPFKICKIERNSPAAKAGLKLNDILISVNGKSVSATSYEETISIIKQELQRQVVQLVVKHPAILVASRTAGGSLTSTSENSSVSAVNTGGSETDEPVHRGANAVQQYQSE